MFLDTSGLLCCFDADERRHSAAAAYYDQATKRCTHNYVLAEFVALCQARGLPRQSALRFASELQHDSSIETIWVDASIHSEAMQLLEHQYDKSYSLCDAVSFVLMEQRHVNEALTTDRHFEQAGFRRLLIS